MLLLPRVEKGRYGAEAEGLEAKKSKREKVEEKRKEGLRENRKIATERVNKGLKRLKPD